MARVRTICASAELPPHLEDMKEELASGEAQLFDVREPDEAMSGMIVGADLVPLSGLQQGMKPKQDPDKITYVHCAAGIRVHYAAPILESLGFPKTQQLIDAMAAAYRAAINGSYHSHAYDAPSSHDQPARDFPPTAPWEVDEQVSARVAQSLQRECRDVEMA